MENSKWIIFHMALVRKIFREKRKGKVFVPFHLFFYVGKGISETKNINSKHSIEIVFVVLTQIGGKNDSFSKFH